MREIWQKKYMFNFNLIDVHLSLEYIGEGEWRVDHKLEFACGCRINRKWVRTTCPTHEEVP